MKEIEIITNQEDEIMAKTVANSFAGLKYLDQLEDQVAPYGGYASIEVHRENEDFSVAVDEQVINMIKVIGFRAYCHLLDNGMGDLAFEIGKQSGMKHPISINEEYDHKGSVDIVDRSFPKRKLQRIFSRKI